MEVTLTIRASVEEIAPMLDLLAERGYIPQQWGRGVLDPLPELESLPSEVKLTTVEQALVQHDLVGLRRQDISQCLGVTPGTITVYRRLIRKKLRRLPADQLPASIRCWLRRFPGSKQTTTQTENQG